MALPRVLFVDDDADVLAGLGKALRKHRERWDMVFANGGPAGVRELRAETFDVIVTDMRMPELDGAALLIHARDHDPTTFRMILSGFSDHNAVTRALPVAHQFFDKPCDLRLLAATIDRACALRASFSGPGVTAVIERIVALGGSTAANDRTRAARIVRLATAAFLEIERTKPTPGADSEHAAALALAAIARELRTRDEIQAILNHSKAIAEIVHARFDDPVEAADAYTAGLVHDLGRILIAVAMPQAHAAIAVQLATSPPGTRRSTVERECLGTTHAELSSYLLALLGVSLPVIEAVSLYDRPDATMTAIAVELHAAHERPIRPG